MIPIRSEPFKVTEHVNSNWLLQPQECKGSYGFSGTCLVTVEAIKALSALDIESILSQIFSRLIIEKGGIDYLQVFKHKETGQKIFAIDQLDREMKLSEEFSFEDDHFTIMFSHEY